MTTNDDIISDNKAEPHYHSSNNQQQKNRISIEIHFIVFYVTERLVGGEVWKVWLICKQLNFRAIHLESQGSCSTCNQNTFNLF